MRIKSLGTEGLMVSAIGLGCMGMSQGYGPADDAESIATLCRAAQVGVTFWDTAQSYGAGDNERLLAQVLAGSRDAVTLATKFGIVRDTSGVRVDARPERVKGDCEASLQRLGTDHIDLYYLHRVDSAIPVEDTVGAMAELVDEGKVRHLGISECSAAQLERAAGVHPLTAVQLEWSLWWREPEDDLIPMARRLGIGIVAFSPLGRGFLAGGFDPASLNKDDFRRRDARFQGAHLAANTAVAGHVDLIAAELGITPAQLALAWLLAQGDDVVPIPGTRRRSRLDENAAAAEVDLSDSDLKRLEKAAPRPRGPGTVTPSPPPGPKGRPGEERHDNSGGSVTAWATWAEVGTALGTLVLAGATFASVRSSSRTARIAERSLLASQRPVLAPSGPGDPIAQVRFADGQVFVLSDGRPLAERSGGTIYLAVPLCNLGAGIAVLRAYHLQSESARKVAADPQGAARHLRGDTPPSLSSFAPQQRDLLISTGRVGFWQAALRDPEASLYLATAEALDSAGRITVDLLYGDHEGGQPTITRLVLLGDEDGAWRADATRHWNLGSITDELRDLGFA